LVKSDDTLFNTAYDVRDSADDNLTNPDPVFDNIPKLRLPIDDL